MIFYKISARFEFTFSSVVTSADSQPSNDILVVKHVCNSQVMTRLILLQFVSLLVEGVSSLAKAEVVTVEEVEGVVEGEGAEVVVVPRERM